MPAVPDKDPNLWLRMASTAKQKQSYIYDICLEDAKLMPWATSTKNIAGREKSLTVGFVLPSSVVN